MSSCALGPLAVFGITRICSSGFSDLSDASGMSFIGMLTGGSGFSDTSGFSLIGILVGRSLGTRREGASAILAVLGLKGGCECHISNKMGEDPGRFLDTEELEKGGYSEERGMRTWAAWMRAASGLVILSELELEDILSSGKCGGKYQKLVEC